MNRELPMFTPPGEGGHGHAAAEPITIAMGGGAFGTAADGSVALKRHPDWIRAKMPSGENYHDLKRLLRGLNLNTVCEEAHCPNIGECWDQRTATIMILGDTCTRACGFCNIKTGRPTWFDEDEPRRVAEALSGLGLEHVVVTSVARDDLPDGGAAHFARTIEAIRASDPKMVIEVLTPDFHAKEECLEIVAAARPHIFNHNLETVERLTPVVRSRAKYAVSLSVLRRMREIAPEIVTKSGLMLGLGEQELEIFQAMDDLRDAGVQVLTMGQYLRPSEQHLPVVEYVHPDSFALYKQVAEKKGFEHVASGPLVRSSYHAADFVPVKPAA